MAFVVAVQEQCSSSSEYRDNLYPLLGLIFNISTAVTSAGLQVGQMLCVCGAGDETAPSSFGVTARHDLCIKHIILNISGRER